MFPLVPVGMHPGGRDEEWGENMHGGPMMGPGGPRGPPPGMPPRGYGGMRRGPPGPPRGRGKQIYQLLNVLLCH